jgi:hypothetical protein
VPDTVTVYGWASVVMPPIDEFDVTNLVEPILYNWDDDYFAGEAIDCPEPTLAMCDAAREFLEVMRREYKVWACEIVETRIIDFKKWREEHI